MKKTIYQALANFCLRYALIFGTGCSYFRFAQPKEPASLAKYKKEEG